MNSAEETSSAQTSDDTPIPSEKSRRERSGRAKSSRSKFNILVRRTHLYAGLFLLPWVFLYGITGAMFNHQGLFPESSSQAVDASVLAATPMANFPAPQQLAADVVEAIGNAKQDIDIKLAERTPARNSQAR